MAESFILDRISSHNIEVMPPQENETIEELHRIIQEELTYGNVISSSKEYVIEVIQSMVNIGAEAVVLGCTEFPLMIKEKDLSIPIFNTTQIHAQAGADYILQNIR